MLEVRKNTFSRSYENTFFRDFSRELSKKFADKSINGLLIGSPFCEVEERLQIDALLITTNVICIIDFKNFSGQINLPNQNNFKQGIWTNATGDMIKGGSSINPYIQLSVQKSRFEKVLKYNILPYILSTDTLNFKHADKVVCFQDTIELIGEIPSEYINFHITDKVHFLEKIIDIVDVRNQTSLSIPSFEAFKKVFLADSYQFDEKVIEIINEPEEPSDAKLQFNNLREDQKFALTQITAFLKDPDKNIFILQGTLNSGKSHLIPYIQELAYRSGAVESEILTSTARIANNLVDSQYNAHSIYSYIYGGNSFYEDSNAENKTVIDTIEEDPLAKRLKIVPLRKCENENSTLFIIEQANSLSDSYSESIDMRFGSGHLLSDFLKFVEIDKTNRKIIFIGDNYQLQIGGNKKSSLNPKYYEEQYALNVEMVALSDNEEFSSLNQQALKCVYGMKQQQFNSLKFTEDAHLSYLKDEEVKLIVTKMIHSQTKCPILTFSNEKALKINLWIKKSILQNSENLAKGDLITLHNNISLAGTSSSDLPVKLFNGDFATVESVSSDIITELISLKGKDPIVLKFIEIRLRFHSSSKYVTILSLENFRLNPKAELSENELLAFKVLLDNLARLSDKEYDLIFDEKIVTLRKQLRDGKKVKTKLLEATKALLEKTPDSAYYKYKNAAFIRFGWSMTVHRSMAYKFDEVIFDVDQEENGARNSESYFRWLYSGLCRAKEHVFLRNYTPITPWDNIEINEKISKVKKSNEDKFLQTISIKVNDLIMPSGIEVIDIQHNQYSELYTFKRNNESTRIAVWYNIQNILTKIQPIETNDLSKFIVDTLATLVGHAIYTERSNAFIFQEDFLEKYFNEIKNRLEQMDIHISDIQHNPYMERYTFCKNDEIAIIDFNYNAKKQFTRIQPSNKSNSDTLVQAILGKLQ